MYRTFNTSVQGSSHLERGEHCQDCSAILEFGNNFQIAAIADGHGGIRHFRSQLGASFAIKSVFETAKLFLGESSVSFSKLFSDTGIKNFKYAVLKKWQAYVKKDWSENPVRESEIRWKNFSREFQLDECDVLEIYGTTLIAAISIGTQVLILQIGDGTCIIFRKSGDFQIPLPNEEKFFNVTDSICNENCKFRHIVLNLDSPLEPILISLSTDGLENSYQNEKHMYKFCKMLVENVITNGMAQTRSELRNNFLPYLASKGSRDDVSLAFMVTRNSNLLKRVYEKMRED